MGFYDHFHSSRAGSITKLGRKLVDLQNRHFVRLIKQHCGTTKPTVLEIGCGHGFFAERCREDGIRYTAIEANSQMAHDLSKRGFDVHQAFAPPIHLDTAFDAIFMDQVFEHMRNRDEAIEMVQTCRSHLKDNGIVLICSPDIFTVKEDFFSDYTHNYPTSIPVLTQILGNGGFQVIYSDYLVFFARGELLTRFIAFCVRFLYSLGFFHVVFGSKARAAKTSLLPSCVVIGRTELGLPDHERASHAPR